MKKAIALFALFSAAAFAQENGSFADTRDEKTYKTVKIGAQTWFAENLNFNAKGSKCYDSKEANCKKHGRLYEWATAKTACPAGWHLPTNKEWDALYRYADGANGTESPYESKTAGKLLKAKEGWNDGNGKSGSGTDNFGFAALPGGGYGYSDGDFNSAGYYGYWWSSSEGNAFSAYYRYMKYNGEGAHWGYDSKTYLHSVRCVMDDTKLKHTKLKLLTAKTSKSNFLTAKTSKSNFSGYNLMKDKDIYNVLKNVAGLQTSGKTTSNKTTSNKTECGDLRDSATGGIGDMLVGLMGGSAGGIGTSAKGTLKAPSQHDIDMGSGDGSRSKADIMAVVNQRMPSLRRIYNQYLKTNPCLTGKVTLKFEIAPSGDIVRISVVSSTTGNSKFDEAIKSAVATWKWKTIKSGNTTPTIPFSFAENEQEYNMKRVGAEPATEKPTTEEDAEEEAAEEADNSYFAE